jgi:hypothetical protein
MYVNKQGAILKDKNDIRGISYTGDSSQIFEIIKIFVIF